MAENAEVVTGAYEAFGRGDIPGVIAAVDPQVQWDSTETLPQGGSYSGPEGVGQFFEAVGGAWESLDINVDELVESGDHVVGIGQATGQLRDSGPAGYQFAQLFTLSGGKITRFVEYAAPDETLRSL